LIFVPSACERHRESRNSVEAAGRKDRSSMARAKSKNKGDEIMKSLDRELAPKIHPSANYNYPSKNNIERTKADECNRGSPSEVKRQLKTSNSTVNYHQFARNFKSHPKMKAVLVQSNCDSAFHPSNCHDYPTIPTTFKRRTSLPDPPPLTSTNSAPAILASKTEKIISNPNLQSPAQPIANEINVPTVQKKIFRRSTAPNRIRMSNKSSSSFRSMEPDGVVLPPTFLYNQIARNDGKDGPRKGGESTEEEKKNESSGKHVAKSWRRKMHQNFILDSNQLQHPKAVNTSRKDVASKINEPLDQKNSHNSDRTRKISNQVMVSPSTPRSREKAQVSNDAGAQKANFDSNKCKTREEIESRGGDIFEREQLQTEHRSLTRASTNLPIEPSGAQKTSSQSLPSVPSQAQVAPDPETRTLSIFASISNSKAKQGGNNAKNSSNTSKFSTTLPTMDEQNPYIMSPSNQNQNFHFVTHPGDGEVSNGEGGGLEPIIFVHKSRCLDTGKSFLSTTSSFTQSLSCFHCVGNEVDCDGQDKDEIGVFDSEVPRTILKNEVDIEASFERMKQIVRRISPQDATDNLDEKLVGKSEINAQDLIRELHLLHSDLCGRGIIGETSG